MKTRITVGEVDIRTDMDLTPRQLRRFLFDAANIAAALTPSPAEEPEAKAPVGFTAHLELDPERNLLEDLSEWFEESP